MEDADHPAPDAILMALGELSRTLGAVAGTAATIAEGQRDLLAHVAESEARQGQDSASIARRIEALESSMLSLGHAKGAPSTDRHPTPPLEDLMREVRSISTELPDLGNDITSRLTDHTDTALAAVLRLIDIRLALLRRAFERAESPAPTSIQMGAVMGATQAAWNRLEQRLDTEFDDLGRQLQSMASLIDAVVTSTEDLANRPVLSGDQLRKAASAVKETVVAANRNRRDRRGGPGRLGT